MIFGANKESKIFMREICMHLAIKLVLRNSYGRFLRQLVQTFTFIHEHDIYIGGRFGMTDPSYIGPMVACGITWGLWSHKMFHFHVPLPSTSKFMQGGSRFSKAMSLCWRSLSSPNVISSHVSKFSNEGQNLENLKSQKGNIV